jgi:putative transposase
MPRIARPAPGGLVYHVLNRGVGRMDLFDDAGDYLAFLRVFCDVLQDTPMRVCGYCLMSNHWHLVLWPERAGDLARFMQRLTITHVRRWVEHRHRVGWGSIYQGRYKSFPIQADAHFRTVVRYVERNPLRAGLVRRAENWLYSSVGQDRGGPDHPTIPLSRWPVRRPADWVQWVNQPQTPAEERAVLRSLQYNRPFGSAPWSQKVEKKLGIPPLRKRGRPKKGKGDGKADD